MLAVTVEVGWVEAKGKGHALPCINWSGKLLERFTVTLRDESITYATAALASGKDLTVSADKRSFTFELVVTADVLVLRV